MLALGYFWTGVSSNQAGTYVLDSDLSSHSVLDGLIEPGATVSLVGCSIGEDRVGLAQCDGPTLIFDLARMWSCRVDAPVGPVGLDDFDETGRFRTTSPATGACRVVTARDRSVSSLPPPPPVRGFTRTLARIIAVETMRILGPHATEAQQRIVTRGLMALGEIAVEQIPYRPILGLPEIVAKLEDGTVATFLSNASIIRLSAPDPRSPCVAYAPVAASEAIRRIIRSVG